MVDHRNYPVDGNGDCKIYMLYKRKLLMEAGFPRQALHKAIVRDLHGEAMPSLPWGPTKANISSAIWSTPFVPVCHRLWLLLAPVA